MPALARAAALRSIPLAVACSCIGLAACGGASHGGAGRGDAALPRTSRESAKAPSPQIVVARVGRTEIRLAEVRHLMALQSAPVPVPVPPRYDNCMAGSGGSRGVALRRACARRYAQLLHDAVSQAIHSQWLIGEAREEGIRVGEGEIRREFEAGRRSLGSSAEFDAYLHRTGQSVADMLLGLRLGRLADGIFANVRRRERPVSAAAVLAYYEAHRSSFAVPEARDVRIVRTTTRESALRIRRELEARGSFAIAARGLSGIAQPITAHHGEVLGLEPGTFAEKPLSNAIFSAHLHELYGPLQLTAPHRTIAAETNSGWFLFEVIRRRPGRQAGLGGVGGAIARRLTAGRRRQTLAGFVRSFRRKWRARTSCRVGYVVRNCRQFVPSEALEPEDPYTL